MGQLVKNVSTADAAYAAGFFDGEGHVRITQHSKRSRSFMLQVTVVQATLTPLVWFKETFGGTISYRDAKYQGGVRPNYTWQASSGCAERFLRHVMPYLQAKRDEAEVAMRYRAMTRDQSVPGGRARLTDAEVSARAELSELLKKMRIDKRAQSLVDRGSKIPA